MWCPFPGCENGQVIGFDKASQITCRKCKKDSCFACKVPYHEGKTCDQYKEDKVKEEMQDYAGMRCPKCETPIEKESGCDAMTFCLYGYHGCKRKTGCDHGGKPYCGAMFCYKCGRESNDHKECKPKPR